MWLGLEIDLNQFFEHSGDEQLSYTIAGNEEDLTSMISLCSSIRINPQTEF